MENKEILETVEERGCIKIFSEITTSLYEDCIIPLLEYECSGTPVDIYLSTEGGDLAPAMCLCDVLDRIQTEVNIYLCGEVLSAGMVIAMGGYENENVTVCAYPSTVGMIHWGYIGIEATQVDMAHDYFDFSQSHVLPLLKQYVESHTNMNAEDVMAIQRKDVWLTAQELLEYGIVDTIL